MAFSVRSAAAAAILVVAAGGEAQAVRNPDGAGERPVEAVGGAARMVARATPQVPAPATAAWRRFTAAHGSWRAIWDDHTGVPARIYGEGVAAPGALADPGRAETAARGLLAEQLALVAPGASIDDFVLVADTTHAGGTRRTVVFAQTYRGLPVLDARVAFLFAADRITVISSTAAPRLDRAVPAHVIDRGAAEAMAVAWIARLYGGQPQVRTGAGGAVVLPLVLDRKGLDAHVVVPVTVDLDQPRGRWTVWLDAASGVPVARRQELHFAQGTLAYHVPQRHPGGVYLDYPAAYADQTVDGNLVTSDSAGVVTWAGTSPASVTTALFGTYAHVFNNGAPPAESTVSLAPDGTEIWDLSSSQFGDAQLNAFIHANIVKRFAIDTLDPGLAWLFQSMNVFVNEDGVCNAFSEGDAIHFFIEAQGCGNTGRISDVVYHEFGHSLHAQSLIAGSFESAESEGISDYLAATITGDPAMGIGFFLDSEEPLRHIDRAGYEYRWPDDIDLDPHETGLIIAGALWDLRKELGADTTDQLFYEMIRRADGIQTCYVEVLAADDDDGDLSNGTPNQCAIDRAFGAHGLTADQGDSFAIVAPPALDDLDLALAQPADSALCTAPKIASATVAWKLRADDTMNGVVDFDVGTTEATAAIPRPADGQVVQYQVVATMDDGVVWTFPRNLADPWYETYVGPVTPIYCTNFDSNPSADGWLLANEFRWDLPSTSSTVDPHEAYTGEYILGTAIGIGGRYDPDTTSLARLDDLNVSRFDEVHLQYRRWLTVEDANRDRAQVLADNVPLWTNLATPTGQADHRDLEWRFHDVDLTPLSGNGHVQIAFQLTSDSDRELGGWNIDDLCVVAPGAPVCGDDFRSADEACDDGNTTDADGCSASCEIEEAPPPPEDGGCCSTGGSAAGSLLLALIALPLVRRRAPRVGRRDPSKFAKIV